MPTYDPKKWMWAEACELLERAERIQRQFFQLGISTANRPTWEPPADIYETETTLVILVALPGVSPAQIQVSIEDTGVLVVNGERQLPPEARRADIYRLEIPHGRFERRIELPPGRFILEQKDIADGCVLLRLRKLR
jgi:HSP20 family molecular chaperone IbpA